MVHAVGHILELLGEELVGVMEHIVFQYLTVKGGDSVDGGAGADTQIGHAALAAPEDSHLLHPAHIPVGGFHQLVLIPAGDLQNDLPDTGQQFFYQVLGPPLQRFGQNGVVGIAHGIGDNMPRLVPVVALLIQQDTHQLCHCHRGMGVI